MSHCPFFRLAGNVAYKLLPLIAITFLFEMCPPVAAQINTGKITGIVTDSAGAVIVGATLRATNQSTGVATTVPSQNNGDYLINFLIPGHYTVEAESTGSAAVLSGTLR